MTIKKKIFAMFVPMIFISSMANGQEYVWPLPAVRQINSTYAEHRFDHFHSGIDIKTNHTTGYPVVAIDDGYIWRLRVSHIGFGKAVYIKLNDGNFAVYGHLDDFAEPLLSRVRKEQVRLSRYAFDLYLDKNEIMVKKGDVLAFSGDTGSQFPHLHFEIRDPNEKPMNPLNFNLDVTDYTVPTIEELAVVPLSVRSRINGSVRIQTFPVYFREKCDFALKDTIRIYGPVGIEVKTFDTIRGICNRYAPYGIKMYVDDSLRFAVQYDQFDFNETVLVDLDRDHFLQEKVDGDFNRLWVAPGAEQLSFYNGGLADGILDLPEGHHSIRVQVYDHNGNTSTLRAVLYTVTEPEYSVKNWSLSNDIYRITLKADTAISPARISASWVTLHGNVTKPAKISGINASSSSETVLSIINQRIAGEALGITIKPNGGGAAIPVWVNLEEVIPEKLAITPRFLKYPFSFLCHLNFQQAPNSKPAFFLHSASKIRELKLIQESPTDYITEPAPFVWWKDAFSLEIRMAGEPMSLFRMPVRLTCIEPAIGVDIFSPDSNFRAIFPTQSVFDTMLCWIDTVSDITVKTGIQESPVYHIFLTTEPLKDSIQVEFQNPTFLENIERYGVYQWSNDRWKFIGNQLDSQRDYIRGSTRKLGAFALLRDEQPPVIKNIFPGNGGKFRANSITMIKASVYDELSGIQDDLSIWAKLDDNPIIVEYCGIKNTVRYKLRKMLRPGKHLLLITVTDRAKNTTTSVTEFQILEDK